MNTIKDNWSNNVMFSFFFFIFGPFEWRQMGGKKEGHVPEILDFSFQGID